MKVSVKWTSKKFDLDVDVSQPPSEMKNQLFSLTGVAPDRQKLLLKGTQIKDDDSWGNIKNLKEGALFMMMGTAGELPKAPENPVKFVEDLRPDQVGQLMNAPPGLVNLGNTCYMNATLQCLSLVSEIQTTLAKDSRGYSQDVVHNISVSLRDLYKQLGTSVEPVPPIAFLTNFRSAYPQFAQQDNRGTYMQQDAEEAWNQLLSALKTATTQGSSGRSVIEQMMGIEFVNSSTCDDPAASSEEAVVNTTSDLRITCHISNQVNNVGQSISEGLVQKLEKNSPSLGRAAMYTVKSQIKRLPKYLTVHFARFFWRSDINQRVKIRRNVAFSALLDMYQYCTPELKSKLSVHRDKGTPHEDLAADPGCNTTGVYELCAVLTHIGASSDSGHYIGWVKKNDKDWFKFDDDKVSPISEADVLKNSGSSADGHIAYLLLYRATDESKQK